MAIVSRQSHTCWPFPASRIYRRPVSFAPCQARVKSVGDPGSWEPLSLQVSRLEPIDAMHCECSGIVKFLISHAYEIDTVRAVRHVGGSHGGPE